MSMKRDILWFLLSVALLPGCRKFVQVPDPDTLLGTGTVFSGDETATAALMGMYSRAMSLPGAFLNGGNTLYPSLSADECTLTQSIPATAEFNDNTLESSNAYIAQLYGSAYNVIYNVNILLENLVNSKLVSAPVRRQIMGEACFIRALVYSRLVVLWGAVPLLTTTRGRWTVAIISVVVRSFGESQLGNQKRLRSLSPWDQIWRGLSGYPRSGPTK